MYGPILLGLMPLECTLWRRVANSANSCSSAKAKMFCDATTNGPRCNVSTSSSRRPHRCLQVESRGQNVQGHSRAGRGNGRSGERATGSASCLETHTLDSILHQWFLLTFGWPCGYPPPIGCHVCSISTTASSSILKDRTGPLDGQQTSEDVFR